MVPEHERFAEVIATKEEGIDCVKLFVFLSYPDLARASMADREFFRASREVHSMKELPFNQHGFGFGSGGTLTSSCTLIALCVCARFFESPGTCDRELWNGGAVRSMYELGALMMKEFMDTVLSPLGAGFGGQGVLARPDEVHGQLHRFSNTFDPLRDLFQKAALKLELEDGSLGEVLVGMQTMARAACEHKPFALLPVLDGKTFAIIVWHKRWICLDSHCRSISGLDTLEKSLVAMGRVDMDLAPTLGEVLMRGGEDAAYKGESSGGFWSLAPWEVA